MEKANLNFSGKDNIIKSICWIFSVLGWLMYLICGWISLKWLDEDNVHTGYGYYNLGHYDLGPLVMTIPRLALYKEPYDNRKRGTIYPLQLQTSVIYIVVILTMLFALFAFIVYMIKSTCKKEGAVFDGMMGDWTRLHSIPLFIAAGLFLIGICIGDKNYNWYNLYNWDEIWDDWEDANIAGIVLVILGLAALIFIYIKTDLPDDWLTASIKKGAYSTLIALEWYYFCYIICNLANIDKPEKSNDNIKGCGIAMPIIEGVIALVFAFFFKDVIIAFMNVLIFLGAAVYYLSLHESLRKKDYTVGHGAAEGIIDIVLMVLAIVVIILLIILKKKECLK